MARVAKERKERDPRAAEQLSQARDQAVNDSIIDQMQQASNDIGQNQLNKAVEKQSESIAKLDRLSEALDKQRDAGLDQLVKKLRQAEKRLAELTEEQERLNKKIQEAAAQSDHKHGMKALSAWRASKSGCKRKRKTC